MKRSGKLCFNVQEIGPAGVVQHAVAFRLWRLPFLIVRHRWRALPLAFAPMPDLPGESPVAACLRELEAATVAGGRRVPGPAIATGDAWTDREEAALRELAIAPPVGLLADMPRAPRSIWKRLFGRRPW